MNATIEKQSSAITAAKIFLAISLIGSIIMAILIVMATMELRKFEKNIALAGFYDYERPILAVNAVIFIINLLVAVWIHRTRKHGMYFIYALFLFIFFVNLDYFWLVGKYMEVKYSQLNHVDVLPTRNIWAIVLNIFSAVLTLLVYIAVRNWNQWSKKRKEARQNLNPKESR